MSEPTSDDKIDGIELRRLARLRDPRYRETIRLWGLFTPDEDIEYLLARLRRAEAILRSAADGYPDETGIGTYYSHVQLRDDARAHFAAQEATNADH